MDIAEAKQILSAYHSDEEHFSDPHMLEALGMLETHPELAAWFERQLSFDSQVKAALADLPMPSNLREGLLGNHRRIRRNKLIRGIRWASALAALLLLGLTGIWAYRSHYNHQMHDYATFREGMSHFVARSYFLLDFVDTNPGNIQDWLAKKQAPVYEAIPVALAEKEPIGCKKMSWKGQDVSLVCFNKKNGEIVHLFVAERSRLSEAAIADLEDITLSHGLETGGWVTDTHVYLLTGSEPGVTVREFLG